MSEKETRSSHAVLPPIHFEAGGDGPETREANLEAVRPAPGYATMALLLADAITKRADLVLMDYTAQRVAVRYQVDGLWHNMPPMEREPGDYLLATLKRLADLDYRERRQRQHGTFVAEYLKEKHKCRLTSQGIASGERVLLEISRSRPPLDDLEQVGMREGMRKSVVQLLNAPHGLILFSALPGDGLSTTWRAALQSCDRFMRDCYVIEEVSRQEPEIINVTPVTYDAAKQQTLFSVLPGVMLREPNMLAFAEMPDAATVNEASQLVNQHDKTVVARIHARHAVEAVLRVLLLHPDVPAFAKALKAVVAQRTLRLLCDECRRAFKPNPKLIQQLGLPPERVPQLYTHFEPRPEEMVDAKGNPIDLEPCAKCGGPGYYERTGIFELLLVDDAFRTALQDQPTVAKLSQVAQQSGHVSLRDEGLVLVARGETSLEELQRVLKK